jgi:peptidyl-prolyl cis-trans isomerase B (cyclophilin B)
LNYAPRNKVISEKSRPTNIGFVGRLWAVMLILPAATSQASSLPGIRVHLQPLSYQIPLGQPVRFQFIVENSGTEPITLTVPGTEPEIPSPEVGLPLEHIFSGGSLPSIVVTTETGRRWDQPVGYRPPPRAPILLLAPSSRVGTTIDLRDYFPSLRGAGQFRVTWQPYGGLVPSATVVITVSTLKEAEIVTDNGTMLVRFFYEDAPAHVANFLELAKSGFYNGTTFHRLAPGYMIQGGCPRGDGTGIRLDGKRIPAEFNGRHHQKGTVSMALLGDDPDSGSCQFFICNTEQKDWDGRYTVFGHLRGEESLATLDKLMATPVDENGRPTRPLYIRAIRVLDAPTDALSETP